MNDLENLYFPDEVSFREWLKTNHDKSPGIWLIFFKKSSETVCIEYHEALDTALCFGWIDSIIKRIDDARYARKFTPRKDTAKWSDFNKERVDELIKKGKMTESGLNKIDSYLKTGKVIWSESKTLKKKPAMPQIPEFIIREFAKNEPALSNFNKLAPSYKYYYIFWITNAKREITQKSRLEESIRLLKENKKLGLK